MVGGVVVLMTVLTLVAWRVKRKNSKRASLLLIQQPKHDPTCRNRAYKDDASVPVVGGAMGGASGTLHKPRRLLVSSKVQDYEHLENVNMDREYEVNGVSGVNEVGRGDGVNEVSRVGGVSRVNEVNRVGGVNEVSEADSGCYDLGTEQSHVDTGRVRGQSADLEGLFSTWKQSISNSHISPAMVRLMTMGGVYSTDHTHHSRNRSHGNTSQRGSLTSSHGTGTSTRTSARTSRSTFSSSSMGYGSDVFDSQQDNPKLLHKTLS